MCVDQRRNRPLELGRVGTEKGRRNATLFKRWQRAASPEQACSQAGSDNATCDASTYAHRELIVVPFASHQSLSLDTR